MKKRKVSLLERAMSDLRAVKTLLPAASDDVDIDVCAYHCQQCIEKTVKFLIELEGKEYSARHDMDVVLEDLSDENAVRLVQSVMTRVDLWISSTRYGSSIMSNKKQVEEVLRVCEQLIKIAESKIPNTEDVSSALGIPGRRRSR